MKRKFMIVIIVINVILTIFAINSFFTPVFYLDGHLYKKKSMTDGEKIYHSRALGKSVKTIDKQDYKEVHIDAEVYRIYGKPAVLLPYVNGELMKVEYPDGTSVEGWYEGESGMFFYKNEKGERELEDRLEMYVGDKRIYPEGGDRQKYSCGQLIVAAFEELKGRNGDVRMLVIGWIILILSLVNLKYPEFFFYLKYGLWVENPEPSDAYLAMAEMGGYIGCIVAVVLAFISVGQI